MRMTKKLMTGCVGIFLLFSHATLMAGEQAQPAVKTIKVNGYNMAYVEQGSGAPVIFVHGSLSDYRTWLHLMEDFSESNRAISVSLRHYYPEKWDGKGDDISLQQHADDIAAFIKEMDLGSAVLIGHSRGAAVAMLMASQHPTLVSKLILADPTPLPSMMPEDTELQAEFAVRSSMISAVMKYFEAGDAESGLREFVDYVAGKGAWEKAPENIRSELRDNSWTLTSMPQDMDTVFSCQHAESISVPVLLVTGDRSPERHGRMQSALKTCLPQSSQIVIADSGHMMINSNPTEFTFETQYYISDE